jgi:dihydrofolate synthase/folylpolyglutamate synthase
MGGRLDSTNVITPVACAVTNIDLEHTQYLGETVEEIAYEKAGIIKKDVPASHRGDPLQPPQCAAVPRAPRRRASQHAGARFHVLPLGPAARSAHQLRKRDHGDRGCAARTERRFPGRQCRDRDCGGGGLRPAFSPAGRAAILSGLAQAKWPCRMERVFRSPPVYIDVAHNPAGAKRLAETFPRCTVLLAVSADKDAAAMLEHLGPIARHFVVTAYDGARALAPAALADLARPYAPVQTAASVAEALRMRAPPCTRRRAPAHHRIHLSGRRGAPPAHRATRRASAGLLVFPRVTG